MKAMLSFSPGGPETLELTDVDLIEPGPDQVRVRVKAAGVNFPDALTIRDLHQIKHQRPFAPGGEVSGIVDAVGANVDRNLIGERVLAAAFSGGFATHFVADAINVYKMPDRMTYDEAATFMNTFGTSHYALRERGDLQPGEVLLILGASGGCGSAAIQLGKAMGARVIAGVSSPSKAKFCKELGADDTLIYPKNGLDPAAQKELSSQIKSICGGKGADVIFDAIGGDYAEPALRAMAWGGRYLVVGFPAGIPKIPLNLPLLKGCQMIGVFYGVSNAYNPEQHQANVQELFTFYNAGKIRPRVTAKFNLEQAGEALKMMEDRQVIGKIVLRVDE